MSRLWTLWLLLGAAGTALAQDGGGGTNAELVQEATELRRELLLLREDRLRENGRKKIGELSYSEAVKLLDNVKTERNEEIKEKNQKESLLTATKRQISGDVTLKNAQSELNTREKELEDLQQEYEALFEKHGQLVTMMKQQGLANWLNAHSRKLLPPAAFGAMSKTTKAMKPVVRRMKRVVRVNQEMAKRMERRVNRVLPRASAHIVNRWAVNFTLVVPLLAFAVLAVRFARSLARLSVVFQLMGLCAMLGSLAMICFMFSAISHMDPIVVIQQENDVLLAVLLLILSAVYLCFLGLLLLECIHIRDTRNCTETAAALFVAYHFFVVVWRRAMIDERPTIRPVAYLLYFTVFGLIFVRRWSEIIFDASHPKTKRLKHGAKTRDSSKTSSLRSSDDSLDDHYLPVSHDDEKRRNSSRKKGSNSLLRTLSKSSSWLRE